jgi:cyclase
MIESISGEAFMPIAYGGGIREQEQVEKLFYCGIEKVVLNSVLHTKKGFDLVSKIAIQYGNQSLVASLDIKKNLFGKKQLFKHFNGKFAKTSILDFAKRCEDAGAGELMLNSVNRDGLYTGYDLELLQSIAESITIPVIISGGASSKQDFVLAEEHGASAMAAGSMFVFQRPYNAVLISYNV